MRALPVLACLVFIAGSLPLTAAPARSAGRPGTVARPPLTAFAGCGPPAVARPDYILLGCGDGGQFLANIRWTSWHRDRASGRAVWWQNLCIPDCAAGHFRHDRVHVSLFRPRRCLHRRRDWFTRMSLRDDTASTGVPAREIVVKAPFLPAATGCP